MDNCKKYGKVKNVPKTITDIEKFCLLLRANKVKNSQEAFLKLPLVVQCLFLHHAWNILTGYAKPGGKKKYTEDSYLIAFYLFKLFRSKDMKEQKVYSDKYNKVKAVEDFYKKALEWKRENKGTTSGSKSTGKRSKKFTSEFQKYESPDSELSPLYIYYTTLYTENSKSRLAITWLTEHGVYDGEIREKLIKKYKKLAEEGKLIK